MSEAGTPSSRLIISLFAMSIVAIAGAEIHKRYIPKHDPNKKETERSPQNIMEQFQGGKDFNRASLDPVYVKKLSDERGFEEKEKASAKAKPHDDRVTQVKGKWWQLIGWLKQK